MIGVTVTGLMELHKWKKQGPENEKRYEEGMRLVAEDAKRLAQLYAPEDYGVMEGAIDIVKIGKYEYLLYCEIPYAVYNEYGTYKMPAGTPDSPLAVISTSGKNAFRPFMRPAAIRAAKDGPKKILTEVMK